MPRALDTEAWADAMQIEALRKMGAVKRMQMTFEISAAAWTMARSVYDRLYPTETRAQRDKRFLTSLYGKDLTEKCIAIRTEMFVAGDIMTPLSPNEFFATTRKVIDALESIGVQYEIGGSVASSLHGVYRTTSDVDIVADLPLSKVDEFIRHLGPEFYADDIAIRTAVREKRSFNAIYMPLGLKIDVFPIKNTTFARSEFARRIQLPFPPPNGPMTWISSPEDIILHKMLWYQSGGETSARQWNDAIGVLRVNKDSLDHAYLARWAEALNIAELLRRAMSEASSADQ
jgi:hypothetical protein